MAQVLIVAYGNPLRGDDGIGWIVADKLRQKLASPQVEILQLQQLLPEVGESISRAETVIFVDASCTGEPGDVRCEQVTAPAEKVQFSHQLSPAEVLGLAGEIYGARPRAFCVTITGECFDHGEGLSDRIAACMPQVVAAVEQLTKQILSRESISTSPAQNTAAKC
jgi:hydrogenase maturation protease